MLAKFRVLQLVTFVQDLEVLFQLVKLLSSSRVLGTFCKARCFSFRKDSLNGLPDGVFGYDDLAKRVVAKFATVEFEHIVAEIPSVNLIF